MDSLSKLISMLQAEIIIDQRCILDGNFTIDHPDQSEKESHFHLVIDGSCVIGYNQKRYIATKGTFVLFPRGLPHLISNQKVSDDVSPIKTEQDLKVFSNFSVPIRSLSSLDSSSVCDLICGRMKYSEGAGVLFMDKLPDILMLNIQNAISDELLTGIGSVIKSESTELSPGSNAIINALVETLLSYALRSYISNSNELNWLTLVLDRRLSKVVAKILNNPEYNWNLSELADDALMSRANFAKRFKEVSQLTPFKFITAVRMIKAVNLLSQTNHPIVEISTMCGYKSESSFNKVFQQNLGKTPGKWRRSEIKKLSQNLNPDN